MKMSNRFLFIGTRLPFESRILQIDQDMTANVQSEKDVNEITKRIFLTNNVVEDNTCNDRVIIKSRIAFRNRSAKYNENILTLFPNSTWDIPEEFESFY